MYHFEIVFFASDDLVTIKRTSRDFNTIDECRNCLNQTLIYFSIPDCLDEIKSWSIYKNKEIDFNDDLLIDELKIRG